MAFATKFRLEVADNLGIVWKVDVQADAWAGAITDMIGSGSPLHFNFYGDDDIWNQNILGSKASFEVISMTDFVYEELFTSDHLQYKVLIYQGATLYWSGFILVNNFQEPYNCPPYPVTLTATDGLGLLSDFKFKDLGYTTRQKTSQVIYDILSLVGVTSFTEFINVYESTMADSVDDSPLDQSGIDPYLFKEDDCYKALEEILKSFSAGIRQDVGGAFTIFRFKELRASMNGRIFTSGTAKSSTTKNPVQYLNRTGQASNFRDVEGGNKTTIPALKTLIINQNYGFRGSMLRNFDFQYEEFTYGTQWEANFWTRHSTDVTNPISVDFPGDGRKDDKQSGIHMPQKSTTPVYYTEQWLDVISSTDTFVIKVESGGYIAGSSAGVISIKIVNTDGVNTKWYSSASAGWVNSVDYCTLLNKTFDGSKNTEEVTFSVTGIPYSGTLTVQLFNANSAGSSVSVIYKSVKIFFVDANGVIVEGIGYTVSGVTNGAVIEKEYRLGDGYGFNNDPTMYAGALNVWSGSDVQPTSKIWYTRGNTENDPLIELIGGELGAQYARSKQLIDIPVYETHDNDFLSLVGTLEDTLNQYGGSNRKFGICRGTLDVKNRLWNLAISEIL
jgi:hypothetical protein